MRGTINISPRHGDQKTVGHPHPSCILLTAHRSLLTFFFLLLTAHCSLLTASAAWTRQPSGTMSWLRGVFFLDQNRGWVAGSGGTVLETSDGGQTWRRLNTLTKDNLRDVYFANEKIG